MFAPGRLPDLAAAPLFGACRPAELDELAAKFDWIFLAGGRTLFRAGDVGDAMYVVLSGRLRVTTAGPDGSQEIVRELARGDSVGELALLTGNRRSATVRAIRDTELARLSREAFEQLLTRHPHLATSLLSQIAERQSQGADRSLSKRNIRTAAVLPSSPALSVTAFARLLAEALAEIGGTLHLGPRSDLALSVNGKNQLEPATVSQRLTDLENRHRFVIYEADAELSHWTDQCVRQADLILFVAAVDAPVDPRWREALELYLREREISAAIELVLLHDGDFHPQIAAEHWLGALPFEDYYHVVAGSNPDCRRLARFLAGSAIGLVLSGGGARGFAHIGILRALEECAIPVDFIGGTSMGAVIAAQHALGWDWRTMAAINREGWPRCHPQRDFTLPLVALNSGERMDRMLVEMFGTVEIQNHRRKFFCVSTNLTRADAMIHRAGPLWKAVRASMSVPGIGPPAIENGEIFVDGGLVNNVPVDVMRSVCHGAICAVDVSEQLEFKSTLQESYSVSGWSLLWRRLNPFSCKPDLPNIFNILYRTTTVGGLRAVESVKAAADLYLSPPVAGFGIFDWRSLDQIMEAGYLYGSRILTERGHELYTGAKTPQ
jgi:NTE family protein/lysophospholipid hydrolase